MSEEYSSTQLLNGNIDSGYGAHLTAKLTSYYGQVREDANNLDYVKETLNSVKDKATEMMTTAKSYTPRRKR